jgi:PI3-kinase family, ras-binding domain
MMSLKNLVFFSDTVLSEYEYVQQCLKLDRDVQFVLVPADSVPRPFKRNVSKTIDA